MILQNKSKDILNITYNISNPPNMIANANANVHSIMPKINTSSYHNSLGVVETGNVSMDLPKAEASTPRKKKKTSSKTKRKKTKNTRKTKDKN
jgi:hypothetical protein